jgi:hypothetical protein
MRKGWKKEKEKGFQPWWAGGNFGPARRSTCAREGAGPAAAQDEVMAQARGERSPSPRAHTPARAKGGNGATG